MPGPARTGSPTRGGTSARMPARAARDQHRRAHEQAAGSASDPAGDARRSVVPPAAGRSLWRAALWTGAGTAVACLIVAVVVVAICWLPVAAGSGGAGTVIRAGALTFLAAVHGGITVDGLPTAFVPLGMTLLVGAGAWRAGCGLADAADDLDETEPRRLLQAAGMQLLAFAVTCGVIAASASLGTSSAPVLGGVVAALMLFAVTGTAAFVRWSSLLDGLRVPDSLPRVVRAAAAATAVYLGGGALLAAGSLIANHDRVEMLSAQVGGGWSGLPVLLLGLLAAPNAAVAGASYLAGPGFAVGVDSHVSAVTTAHGLLPAFPMLGAVPTGHGAPWPAWLLMSVTFIAAGAVVGKIVTVAGSIRQRLREAALVAALLVPTGCVLAWQAGGAIGSGRLRAVGASPWQFGLALAVVVGVAGVAAIGVGVVVARVRRRTDLSEAGGLLGASLAVVAAGVASYREERAESAVEPDRVGTDRAAPDRAAAPAAPEPDRAAPEYPAPAPAPATEAVDEPGKLAG